MFSKFKKKYLALSESLELSKGIYFFFTKRGLKTKLFDIDKNNSKKEQKFKKIWVVGRVGIDVRDFKEILDKQTIQYIKHYILICMIDRMTLISLYIKLLL